MPIEPHNLIGFAGAAILMAAYFANQQRWLSSEDWRFPGLNFVGSAMIFVSLWFEWNFPSVVIEVFWAAISVWGIFKSLADRRPR